jgi:hypothetical protein
MSHLRVEIAEEDQSNISTSPLAKPYAKISGNILREEHVPKLSMREARKTCREICSISSNPSSGGRNDRDNSPSAHRRLSTSSRDHAANLELHFQIWAAPPKSYLGFCCSFLPSGESNRLAGSVAAIPMNVPRQIVLHNDTSPRIVAKWIGQNGQIMFVSQDMGELTYMGVYPQNGVTQLLRKSFVQYGVAEGVARW